MRRVLKKNWDLYLLLLPAIGLTLLFRYVPIYGALIAFKDFNIFQGFASSPWVGFSNFQRVFSDDAFYGALGNTLIISMLKLLIVFPMPVLLALLMNEVGSKWFKRTIQTTVYLPHFLSWAIVYGIFYALLKLDGPINQMLYGLGFQKTAFFVNAKTFRGLLVVSDLWKTMGWGSIIYLAAITAIDPALYESAMLDGANRLQRIRYITLPSIASTIVVMLVLRLGSLLNAGLEQILIMYNPAVYAVADVIDTYVYRTGIGQQDYSYASAVGLFNSVVNCILVIGSNAYCKRRYDRSLW